MFAIKEWTRIEPCVCGRLMHQPDAKFCSWCGRKLADSHDESTVQLIAQAEQLKSAFEAWKAKHQPPEKVAGAQEGLK